MVGIQRFGPVLLVAACASLSACGGDPTPPTQADTTFGRIEGVDNSATTGTLAWKGVPYAKPPVGALRWMAPVDPDPWTTPRATTQFANPCVQYGRIYGPGSNNTYDATIGTTLNQAVGSEDCLYLNVWRPANSQVNLPVIVFIHGGSNVSGYTADPVYDGAVLARTANAVVVTANYRLGIFGWLNLPQLKQGTNPQDDSGNFAVLDNIKALQFINRNIAAFGGNPGNVTVMGQSAGAIDVYALLTSPLMVNANPKLMHRAVPLSGGISLASNLPAGSGNFGPSLFSNVANSTANRPGRLDLSDAMMKSVGAFAANGDPNNAALGVAWPAWPSKLIFDATATVKTISVQ